MTDSHVSNLLITKLLVSAGETTIIDGQEHTIEGVIDTDNGIIKNTTPDGTKRTLSQTMTPYGKVFTRTKQSYNQRIVGVSIENF